MNDKQNIIRYTLIGIISILIIWGIVYFVTLKKPQSSDGVDLQRQQVEQPKQEVTPPVESATTTPTSTPPKTSTAPAPKKTTTNTNGYEAALEKYGKGLRIQFVECHSNPGKLVVKSGVAFMLDNREGNAHVFKVAGQTFNIPAWGYTITSIRAEGDHDLTCDGGGSAVITVQP
jgi:hypothetical protein